MSVHGSRSVILQFYSWLFNQIGHIKRSTVLYTAVFAQNKKGMMDASSPKIDNNIVQVRRDMDISNEDTRQITQLTKMR